MALTDDDTASNRSLGDRIGDLGWRRIAFTILVVVPLGLYFGVFGFWRNQLLLVTSWFGGVGLLEPAFYDVAHRLHEFAAVMVLWPLVVGLLAQVRSPRRHVAGMLMAVWSLVSVLVAIALTGGWELAPIVAMLGVPTLLAALVHRAGRRLLTGFDPGRASRYGLALVVLAAVPLLAFAATQVGLQTGALEAGHDHAGHGHDAEVHQEHVDLHHYTFVAAFAICATGVGLLASLRPPGAWVASWLAGAMVGIFGLAGLLAPAAASNPGLPWNLGAIAWAASFVVLTNLADAVGVSALRGRSTDG